MIGILPRIQNHDFVIRDGQGEIIDTERISRSVSSGRFPVFGTHSDIIIRAVIMAHTIMIHSGKSPRTEQCGYGCRYGAHEDKKVPPSPTQYGNLMITAPLAFLSGYAFNNDDFLVLSQDPFQPPTL